MIGALLACLPLWAAAPAEAAAAGPGQVALSEPLDSLEQRLAAAPTGAGARPLALILDRDSLDPRQTHEILMAIADRRIAGGSVIAIAPKATSGAAGASGAGGVAAVALACDAVVFETGATLRGAGPNWCASAARRKDLAETLAELGRVDPLLAGRLIDAEKPLSWSLRTGFAADSRAPVRLAAANEPLALSASLLKSVGFEAREFQRVSEAVAAIDAGSVTARAVAAPIASAPAPGASPGAPAAAKPEVRQPLDPEVQAKVDAKVKEYGELLDELKRDLEEFNEHFHGRKGKWTSGNDSLKEVWRDKSDNTRDSATKLRCERLQRGIKENASSLGRIAKSVDRLIKDPKHPLVVRLTANQEQLDGLRAAIDRNKVDDYERFHGAVEKLQ